MGKFGGFELFGRGGAFVAGFGGCEGFSFGGAVVGLLSAAAEPILGHSRPGHRGVGAGGPADSGMEVYPGVEESASLVKELAYIHVSNSAA